MSCRICGSMFALTFVMACASGSLKESPVTSSSSDGNESLGSASATSATASATSSTAASSATGATSLVTTMTTASATSTAALSSNITSPSTSTASASSTSDTATSATTTTQDELSDASISDPTSDDSSDTEVVTGQSTESNSSNGDVAPSPGCDGASRPDGGKIYVAEKSWLVFPDTYEGSSTPMPVLFGFHGCGMGNRGNAQRTEYTDLTAGNALGRDYVVAIPISADGGGCWNYGTDIGRVLELYDTLINDHCVDMNRVFATGHSSGAQFIVQLLQGNHSADAEHLNFKGMAPVAASAYDLGTPMAVMYIQGQRDTVRGNSNGKDVVDAFVARNQCGQQTTEYMGVDGCQSGGTAVDPGCVEYSDCSTRTVWCSHNDPAYDNTSHGVPCFAAQAMDHFFKSL